MTGFKNAIRTRWRSVAVAGAVLFSTALPATAAEMAAYYDAPQSRQIDGQYIVVMEDDNMTGQMGTQQFQKMTAQRASSVASAVDGQVLHTFGRLLHGFVMELDQSRLNELRQRSDVKYVEEDQMMHAYEVQENATWGIDRVDQQQLPLDSSYEYNTGASDVHAYVIDTGIDLDHPQFGNRAEAGFDAIGDGRNTEDCQGHGTHVAGTIGSERYGLAKDVNLVAVRVLGCDGNGSNSGVIDGVEWVAENAELPAVANMSLGGGASRALDDAVNNAIDQGITFAVAAGNSDVDACGGSPNRVERALTTGSTTKNDARSGFSNWGNCVDINAPGSNITSAWLNGGTNTISGTSMASPHVAGAAALYQSQNPDAAPAEVFDALVSNATEGQLSNLRGSPNRLLFTEFGDDDDDGNGDVVELTNGKPVTGLAGNAGDKKRFTLNVPANAQNLRFEMSGGSGDADLYVRFGQKPTTSTYDCRPWQEGNNETCQISTIQGGVYHVMVHGWERGPGFDGVSLVGSFEGQVGNEAPTAAFGHSADGLSVTVDGSDSSDSDGQINAYKWDFGNGQTASGQTASVTYGEAGTYDVTLTVMDDNGAEDTATQQVTVEANDGAQAPCQACSLFEGSLSGRGDRDTQPNGSYFEASGFGSHRAWLKAPDNADYTVTLYYYNGYSWNRVAQTRSQGSVAELSYFGRSGYYTYMVSSNGGQGDYDLWIQSP